MRGRRVGDHFSDGLSCAAERDRGEGMEGLGGGRGRYGRCVFICCTCCVSITYLSEKDLFHGSGR